MLFIAVCRPKEPTCNEYAVEDDMHLKLSFNASVIPQYFFDIDCLNSVLIESFSLKASKASGNNI